MSAQEIIAELPKLTRQELEILDARLHQLLQPAKGHDTRSWGDALLEVAGSVENLPPDYAQNHDHYLHGLPKR